MLFCKHDTPCSSMLGAHSWSPEGRPGHWGHLCSGRRAAAWQLPQCVYPSPDAAAARACWKQLTLSRPEAPGCERMLQQISSAGLTFLLSLTESLGPWGSEASWGFLLLKKHWEEDFLLSISIREMEGGWGFPVICPQEDYIFLFSSARVNRILVSL